MRSSRLTASVAAACSVSLAALLPSVSVSADPGLNTLEIPITSLKDLAPPEIADLDRFVKDRSAAVVLGKAFFWDTQVGSDGQACASCHFHAGADSRLKNQLNPGQKGGDNLFEVTATGGGGPNYTLVAGDFPFSRFADPTDRNTLLARQPGVAGASINDVVSSQGTQDGEFRALNAGSGTEVCDNRAEDVFVVGHKLLRKVEPRNTPTVINAVFNFHNFWDGRADNLFNGASPRGPADPNAGILVKTDALTFVTERIGLANGSAASQSVGPPTNNTEMSCNHKAFAALGRKLVNNGVTPLGIQTVAADDSVLAPYRHPSGQGLNTSYLALIQAAFRAEFIDNVTKLNLDGSLNGASFTQLELNFPLVWGLAVQLYETTLKADDTPLDRFLKGDSGALTGEQQLGFATFTGKGHCSTCHMGAELTDAAVRLRNIAQSNSGEVGFHFTGNRPAADDPGRSEFNPAVTVGAVKTPQLRNVSLTQPFFAQGGAFTLEQVVEAYSRGQNLPANTLGVDKEIKVLGLNNQQQRELVAFLRFGLTDLRVACETAPFDHPSLRVANGHVGNQFAVVDSSNGGRADDDPLLIPPVGAGGLPAAGLPCLANDDGSANH